MINIKELLEAEKLIEQINQEPNHPVNNYRHPNHLQAYQALRKLERMVWQERIRLEVENRFKSQSMQLFS